MILPEANRIVIFGASGFVGSHLRNALTKATSYEIVAHSSGSCDLLDGNQVSAVIDDCSDRTTLVICSAIGRHIDDSFQSMCKNALMVENIISAISSNNIRSIIFLSSICVYGVPPEELPISELSPLRPNSYYGISKVICEQLLQSKLLSEVPVAILRLPGVYGVGDGGKSVVAQFATQLAERGVAQITGDGSTKRDFVAVEDVCKIVCKLIESPCKIVLNIATGESYSIYEVASIIAAELGVHLKVDACPADEERQGDLVFDTKLLKTLFPKQEMTNLRDGVKEYLLAGGSALNVDNLLLV